MNTTNYEVLPLLAVDSGNWTPASGVNADVDFEISILGPAIYIFGVAWGYSAPPAAGATLHIFLTINGTPDVEILTIPITQDGPGVLYFRPALKAGPDDSDQTNSLTIRLSAGGAGITGYLNILGNGV